MNCPSLRGSGTLIVFCLSRASTTFCTCFAVEDMRTLAFLYERVFPDLPPSDLAFCADRSIEENEKLTANTINALRDNNFNIKIPPE